MLVSAGDEQAGCRIAAPDRGQVVGECRPGADPAAEGGGDREPEGTHMRFEPGPLAAVRGCILGAELDEGRGTEALAEPRDDQRPLLEHQGRQIVTAAVAPFEVIAPLGDHRQPHAETAQQPVRIDAGRDKHLVGPKDLAFGPVQPAQHGPGAAPLRDQPQDPGAHLPAGRVGKCRGNRRHGLGHVPDLAGAFEAQPDLRTHGKLRGDPVQLRVVHRHRACGPGVGTLPGGGSRGAVSKPVPEHEVAIAHQKSRITESGGEPLPGGQGIGQERGQRALGRRGAEARACCPDRPGQPDRPVPPADIERPASEEQPARHAAQELGVRQRPYLFGRNMPGVAERGGAG